MATTVLTGRIIRSGSIPATALGGGVISASAQLATSLPAGAVSSSAQIDYNSITNKLSGVVSSSAQVTPLLPINTISGSTQFKTLTDPFTGSFTGSFTGDGTNLTGIAATLTFSGSTSGTDTLNLKTEGLIFSGSNGITATVTNNTVTLTAPAGTVSASSQVDYNNIQNKLSGVVSSSAQVAPLLPGGTVSSSLQINTGSFSGSITSASFATTASAATSITFTPLTSSFATSASYASTSSVANASTLTGNTLASNVLASSLTSVGTLTALTTSGTTSLATTAGAVTIRSVPYTFPSSQGAANTSLVNNGTGTLAWTVVGSATPTQTDFTASGTWTKPPSGTMALVEVWGGGGGGGAAGSPYAGVYNGIPQYAAGGGGGSYKSKVYRLAELSATVTVTVGAGGSGIAITAGDYVYGNGTSGGTTSFGSLISAFGGKGGRFNAAPGVTGPGGNTTIPTANLAYVDVDFVPSNGSWPQSIQDSAGNRMGAISYLHVDRVWNGGCGFATVMGAGSNATLNQIANSVYGGGGGVGDSGSGIVGGTSVFGGNGGNVNTDGSTPAGGGGGSRNIAYDKSGNGGNGLVRVTVFG
jgi:hypothetical protein